MSYAETFPAPPWAMRRKHHHAARRARMMAFMSAENTADDTSGRPDDGRPDEGRGPRRGHQHGRGPGRGPGFGPGGWGGRGPWGPPRGRRRERGDVRAAILLLLAEQPRHGYEILTELSERSGGDWRPSPGSVYPQLKRLAKEGLVNVEHSEGKGVFSLTAEGQALVDTEGESWGEPWAQAGQAEPSDALWAEFRQLAAAAAQVGQLNDAEQCAAVATMLTETRKRIYGLLAQ